MKTKGFSTCLNNGAIFILLLIAITLLSTSCIKYHIINGNGRLVTHHRLVKPFTQINCMGDLTVVANSDSITKVTVEAEENIMPFIETYVSGDVLIIKETEHIRLEPRKKVTVYINAPCINRIDLMGSGKIFADSLNASRLDLNISGSGDMDMVLYVDRLNAAISGSGEMELYGYADEGNIKISGSGKFYAYQLYQYNCSTTTTGSGDMYLNVTDNLDVLITGSGNVFYKGNPRIKSRITGSGAIIAR